MSLVSVGPKGASFTIDPRNIRTGQNVYITTSTGALTSISMAVSTKKPSPLCATNPPTP